MSNAPNNSPHHRDDAPRWTRVVSAIASALLALLRGGSGRKRSGSGDSGGGDS